MIKSRSILIGVTIYRKQVFAATTNMFCCLYYSYKIIKFLSLNFIASDMCEQLILSPDQLESFSYMNMIDIIFIVVVGDFLCERDVCMIGGLWNS